MFCNGTLKVSLYLDCLKLNIIKEIKLMKFGNKPSSICSLLRDIEMGVVRVVGVGEGVPRIAKMQ